MNLLFLTLSRDQGCDRLIEGLSLDACVPIHDHRGTARICQDDMGKEAVRAGLKKIKLVNVNDKAAMRLSFEGGVLEMHCAYALGADGMFSDGAIRELLDKKL